VSSDIVTLLEEMQMQIINLEKRIEDLESAEYNRYSYVYLKDATDEPSTLSGWGLLFIDNADGDLKIKFGDGTLKTIIADT
jgi:hypothetical protein